MSGEGVCYDQETIELRKALDDAWDSLTPQRQQTTLKVDLAERILSAAGAGERDPEQLRMRALLQPSIDVAAPLNGAALILRSVLSREET